MTECSRDLDPQVGLNWEGFQGGVEQVAVHRLHHLLGVAGAHPAAVVAAAASVDAFSTSGGNKVRI